MQWRSRRTKVFRKSNSKDKMGESSSKPIKGAQAAQQYSGDSRNKNDIMYTTILASKTQKKLAGKIMRALERTGEVTVESKASVVGGGGNDRGCAENTVNYILQDRVTGVVVLSSKELNEFLNGDGKVELQITEEDVQFEWKYIADAFKQNEDVRSKLLLVVPDKGCDTEVEHLQGVDMVRLGEDASKWDKDIVARFMKKISIRR